MLIQRTSIIHAPEQMSTPGAGFDASTTWSYLRRKCEKYNFCISYNPGTQNTADPLSRGEIPDAETLCLANITLGDKVTKVATILRLFAGHSKESQTEFERGLAKEDEQWSEEARASISYIYTREDTEGWEENCSCNYTTACSYSYTDDDEELKKTCKCIVKSTLHNRE